MLGTKLRPWGLLSWVIERISKRNWSMLGCLATEERCIPALNEMNKRGLLNSVKFFEVVDPPSGHSIKSEQRRDDRRSEFIAIRSNESEIEEHELLESAHDIVTSVKDFCENATESVILDISSFPKRFFFPIVRQLLQSSSINNLIVTYTVPEQYHTGDLAENPGDWHHLPLFMPEVHPDPSVDLAIVGIGFLPFGLPELLKGSYSDVKVKLLFPFPPGPPNYQRTWEFVRKIEKSYPLSLSGQQINRVNAVDVCDVFNHILSLTALGEKVIFAPYGPKPLSLAMCIYASKTKSPVYYTQPKQYHPEYCTGVKTVRGSSETYAYCLRLNGNDFYLID